MHFRAPIFSSQRLLRAGITAALTVLFVLVGQLNATAATTSGITCTGFAGCAERGYSDHGYSAVHRQSFWGATAGHNCTNYVAYRLSHHGRLAPKPATLGAASHWGVNVAKDGIPVVSTPKVGDVAWWSYLKGNPIRSHVAIVEKVHADGSILVSEDNLGGDFDWRTVAKGTRFPSGFIRFPRSDGSPAGKVAAATNEKGKVTVRAYNDEPDAPGRASTILVSWGGPRGAAGTLQTTSSKPLSGNWHLYRTFAAGKVPQVAYLYALNTPGTKGSDHAYGRVAIPGGTVPEVAPPKAPTTPVTVVRDTIVRTTTTLTGVTQALLGQPVRLRATVTDQDGNRVTGGTATLTGPGGLNRTATLVDGTAVFELPGSLLPLGLQRLEVRYNGSGSAAASSAGREVRTLGSAAVTMATTKKPSRKATGRADVTVRGTTTAKPTGKVTVFLKKKGQATKKVSGNLRDGRVRLTLPRTTKKGSWTVVVRYYGSTRHAAIDRTYTIRDTR